MADGRSGVLKHWLRRAVMTGAHRLLQLRWFVTRPRTFGVRAIALSPEGRIVLIRHSYVRGWYLPGGGRAPDENPEAAILRELGEEIGLEDHDAIRHLGQYEHRPTFKRDRLDLFLVEGARYRWTPSLEIEEVGEFDPRTLPADLSARSRADISQWLTAADPSPPQS
jgi:8-oxo-dGTP pyrophosphatase MutT (NUDIX family)